MKRLFFLPATILFTTVLGSLFSAGFAQTPEDSQQTSPIPNGTETPTAPEQKTTPTPDGTETPTVPEQKITPTPDDTETPTAPEQKTTPTPDETETPTAPEQNNTPTPDGNQTPKDSQAKQGAYMGIQMITLTPEIAQEFNNDPSNKLKVPETKGILIVGVISKSPAETAGLRRGDVITEISGKPTTDAKEVLEIVSNSDIGESLPLKVMRENQTNSISVRLGEKPLEKTKN